MNGHLKRVRQPAMAGRFYEGERGVCREMAIQLCEPLEEVIEVPEVLHGAMLPHAGWMFSGAVAGRAIRKLHEGTKAKTVLLTGAIHTPVLTYGPTLDSADAWATPLGEVEVDKALREAIGGLDDVTVLDMAHESEHSLEVELPLLQVVFGEGLKIVPCLIPVLPNAAEWGKAMGELLKGWDEEVVVVSSSDLTHYGPNYRFVPQGVGAEAIAWAHEVNDNHLLDLIGRMDAGAIVPEVRNRGNACGGGSIAATIAAVNVLSDQPGAHLLEHTSSAAVLAEMGQASGDNSVGYAGMVFS